MKKVFTMILCLSFVGFAQAQLSQGETYSSKIVNGNRPKANDWGLYVGPSYSEVYDLIKSWARQNEQAYGLPLVNVKYYATDRSEVRLGIQFNGYTTKVDGNYDVNYSEMYGYEGLGTRNIELFDKYYNRRFRITPGYAYHFSPKNILDVYVGATIPIGVDAMREVHETQRYDVTYNASTGDPSLKEVDVIDNYKYSSFVIGLGAFVGLQVFVADLPFSIGLEYGFTGMLRTNDKWYREVTDTEGVMQSYYTTDRYSSKFDELSSKTKYTGSDIRLTFTYYFNNK